jgi:hypothetical protein
VALLALLGGAGHRAAFVHHFETGFDSTGRPLPVPSIDPAGIAWHEPSGRLFIVDSEIDEVKGVFASVGGNVFEASPLGDVLYATYDLTVWGNREPTGIAWSPFDGRFYVTDDDRKRLERYSFAPDRGFVLEDSVSTLASAESYDPEDVTVDPDTGLIYVVDGRRKIVVYAYDESGGGFELRDVMRLKALNAREFVPDDPEGIAFDRATGNLLLVSAPDLALCELTTAGIILAICELDASGTPFISPQGMTFAPTSDPDDETWRVSLFIADGGVDNDDDRLERDGYVFEGSLNSDSVMVQAAAGVFASTSESAGGAAGSGATGVADDQSSATPDPALAGESESPADAVGYVLAMNHFEVPAAAPGVMSVPHQVVETGRGVRPGMRHRGSTPHGGASAPGGLSFYGSAAPARPAHRTGATGPRPGGATDPATGQSIAAGAAAGGGGAADPAGAEQATAGAGPGGGGPAGAADAPESPQWWTAAAGVLGRAGRLPPFSEQVAQRRER